MEQQLDNENNEAEIQAKMDLLQKEIVDKNLDKNSFVNYCLRKKENGDDLNSWTISELKELIQDFVNSKSAKQVEEKKEEEEIKKENVEKIEKFNVNFFYLFFIFLLGCHC